MSLAWLHAPRRVAPDVLDLCQQAGKVRLEYHKAQPWYRGWNLDGYVIGCLGEALVSELSGIPWDPSFNGGDEGFDFPETDCKAVPVDDVMDEGWLRRLADSKKWQPYYCLVVVQRDLAAYRYTGWASGLMLSKAKTRDFGFGATCVINERSLIPGLPPPLTKKGAA